jgi:Mg-chelatase subunit ChlD
MKHGTMKAVVLSAVLLASATVLAKEEAGTEPSRPRVEVVFVLDTTGSMSGLIQAAKEKIWAIANTLATTKPAPLIKMGLVGYRDRGDAYITKKTDLTDDLDVVYETLMGFQASGGGDTPESVNQALHEAVTQLEWTKDEGAYRVIFLVGDCPPHMDYNDDVKYPETCKIAAKAGIIINTIQCGTHAPTEPIWTEIADRAEGRYFRVEQSGGAILASTPFDAELAGLSRELEGTRLYYGSKEKLAESREREVVAARIHTDAPVSARAARAVFSASEAGASTFAGAQELLKDIEEGRVKLTDLKEEELPENLQKMSVAEREKFVAAQAAKREEVQAKIKELATKRQAHIEEQVRKSELKGKQSLDFAIFNCIKEQAGKKGIIYKGGPAY